MPQPTTATERAAREQRSTASHNPLSVLLVEDDCATSQALKLLLARRGWDVRCVTTLGEAMRALIDKTPEYLILDLMLPDGDGTKILQYIRMNKLPTKVTVTTAATDHEMLHRVIALGPEMLLKKPIDLAELFRGMEPKA